jgi:hypothetical protein
MCFYLGHFGVSLGFRLIYDELCYFPATTATTAATGATVAMVAGRGDVYQVSMWCLIYQSLLDIC